MYPTADQPNKSVLSPPLSLPLSVPLFLGRQIHVGPFPIEHARTCASAIVNGALRGQNWVRVPWWYTTIMLYRVFAPDVVESFSRLVYSAPLGRRRSPSSWRALGCPR